MLMKSLKNAEILFILQFLGIHNVSRMFLKILGHENYMYALNFLLNETVK